MRIKKNLNHQLKDDMKTSDPQAAGANTKKTDEDSISHRLDKIEVRLDGHKDDFLRVGKSEDMIKWMATVFSGVAIALIGFHVYISNNNYDHERQTLQDQINALSKQLVAEQDATEKTLNDRLTGIVAQKLDAADAEIDKRFNLATSGVNARLTEQATNLDVHLQDLRNMSLQIGDTAAHVNDAIDQKVGLAMASGFINVAANLAAYKQYTLATQCYLNAAHQFMIGQDFGKLKLCVTALWKTCLPHIKRDEFMEMEKGPYELDLLICGLSSFEDKRYYDDANSLKYERKRLTGEDYPTSFKPSPKDAYWVQKLSMATTGVSQ
jgi:hypothetical protein